MNNESHAEHGKGLAAGLFCFVFWGFAPVYFKLLQTVPSVTIIAHRILWSLLFILLYLVIRERKQLITALKINSRQLLYLLITGVLIVSNWLLFVWAVTHDRILDSSLGYFITPLMNVFFGKVFLGERLTRYQWAGLILALAATLFFAFSTGTPPWVALMLATTFGLYGLLRKKLKIRPMIGLFWEVFLLLIPAMIFIAFFAPPEPQATDHRLFLLVLSGIITLLPLIGFNYAANHLPLVWIGFLQYIAPSISFLLAVIFYSEDFTWSHQWTFGGIWLALIVVSIGSLRNRRNSLQAKNLR